VLFSTSTAPTVGLPDRVAAAVIAVAALLVIVAGWRGELHGGYSAPPRPRPRRRRPRPGPDEEEMVRHAAKLVHELAVAPEVHHDTYDRAAFGSGWASVDGCSVRSRVLIEESLTEPKVADGCAVVAGEWYSWYDGQVVTDPTDLDVDHLVPLAEAWASGAWAWTAEERVAFANDLDRPEALVAVTASVNREKGDLDPNHWRPHHPDTHCRYVAAWVIQKHAWGLTVDADEQRVLVDILSARR
jgi:hypothetical protein